jgi:hypothetical protein
MISSISSEVAHGRWKMREKSDWAGINFIEIGDEERGDKENYLV